jgi:hypothetical protein
MGLFRDDVFIYDVVISKLFRYCVFHTRTGGETFWKQKILGKATSFEESYAYLPAS